MTLAFHSPGLTEALTEALLSLRDVPGVLGSFVVSDFGRLLARDMPALFGDDVLGEVAPRTLRLRETLADGPDALDTCVVRYPSNLLVLRPLRDGLICALTEPEVNVSSLRMAMTLSVRRLNLLLESPAASSFLAPHESSLTRTPASQEIPLVSRTQELPAADPFPSPRFYRGSPVPTRRR